MYNVCIIDISHGWSIIYSIDGYAEPLVLGGTVKKKKKNQLSGKDYNQ